MKGHKKRGSIFTLLLRNYIVFTVLLVLILTGLFVVYFLRMIGLMAGVEPSQIETYHGILAEQRYEEFPVERLLGAKGFIMVLDQHKDITYQSGTGITLPELGIEDLACIPDYSTSPEVTVRSLTTVDGQKQTAISVRETGTGIDREYILDDQNRVLYQTGGLPSDILTSLQVKLLSDTYDTHYSLQKYDFKSRDGENNTLLLFWNRGALGTAIGHSWGSFLSLIVLAYVILVFFFILWLKRSIKRPLQLLCMELNDFVSGEVRQADYSGPREFVEIFDSFHAMSLRLQESETERKRLEADKQKMLADISHDLKTPITVLQGYAKALCDGVVPQREELQYLETIEQKAEGLNELINTFYEYSKMEHPDYSLSLAPGDICNYLRDYVADQYSALELAGFLLQVDIPEEHILCSIDTVQLKRVFENIVNNAVNHNQSGTTLYFSLQSDAGQVRIILADNGVGIPQEIGQSIFEPFVVGEAFRNKHGSGLGLSVAKKIVEAHHGTIRLLEPQPPHGTAFEVVLPILSSQS